MTEPSGKQPGQSTAHSGAVQARCKQFVLSIYITAMMGFACSIWVGVEFTSYPSGMLSGLL